MARDDDRHTEVLEQGDIMRRLRMVKSRHPVAPLLEGRWE
jgi:hypothetical protein